MKRVTFDQHHRPWFELSGSASLDEIKLQVEQYVSLQAPWVRGAHILLVDSEGRLWLLPRRDLLLGYDPRTQEWIEHHAKTDAFSMQPPDLRAPGLIASALEDRDGRVFIGDRGGCHVFDRGRWSYQPFYDLNFEKHLYFGDTHEFDAPLLARDQRGRVYAWTPWGREGCTGTLGLWVHLHDGWEQLMTGIGQPPGRISAVVPLSDGRVMVCPEAGPVSIIRVDSEQPEDDDRLRHDIELLGSDDFHQRRDAERRILDRGPHVLGPLRQSLDRASSPEQRARIELAIQVLQQKPTEPQVENARLANGRFWGRDGSGRIILWADAIGQSGRDAHTAAWLVSESGVDVQPAVSIITQWMPQSLLADSRHRLFMAQYHRGLGVWDGVRFTQLTDDADLPFDALLGEDDRGRVYARNPYQVVAIDLEAPDTRRSLDVQEFELATSRPAACLDLQGHTLARLAGAAHPLLSVFRDGRWAELPPLSAGRGISDLAYFQPLREGGIIAQEIPGGEALYFDGRSWISYPTLHELIARNYVALVRRLDNQHPGVDAYTKLRLDDRGGIWCVEWNHLAMYDGKQWRSLPGGGAKSPAIDPVRLCVPLSGGAGMLLSDGTTAVIARSTPAGIDSQPLEGIAAKLAQGALLDSAGRLWTSAASDSALVLEGLRQRLVTDTGTPRFQDAAGRIWFVNPLAREIVVLDRQEHRLELSDDFIFDQTTVAQDKADSYWINTRRGLLHVVGNAGRLKIDGPPYERGLPKDACGGMWVDADHALWFAAQGRLYRIRIP